MLDNLEQTPSYFVSTHMELSCTQQTLNKDTIFMTIHLKPNCNACMFTCHMVGVPAATSSAAYHPPLRRCH